MGVGGGDGDACSVQGSEGWDTRWVFQGEGEEGGGVRVDAWRVAEGGGGGGGGGGGSD